MSESLTQPPSAERIEEIRRLLDVAAKTPSGVKFGIESIIEQAARDLLAALDLLRADAERIDWLDDQRQDNVIGWDHVGCKWEVGGRSKSVREAIDAARATPSDTRQP